MFDIMNRLRFVNGFISGVGRMMGSSGADDGPGPGPGADSLLLDDGTSFLLLDDGVSFLLLD